MWWHVLLHVVVGVLIALLASWAYATVLPAPAPLVIGLALGGVEVIAPLFAKHGASLQFLARAGLPLLTWPVFGLIFQHALHLPWTTGMVLASICASATGFSTRSHAAGRDSQGRIIESILAVAIPLYAVIAALVLNADPTTLALAAAGAAVGCLVAYQSRTWPGTHETALLVSAGACGLTAVAWLLADLIAMA